MSHDHAHDHDCSAGCHSSPHQCGNLFGCGDEMGTGVVREDIKEAVSDRRATDRLLHMDEVDQAQFDSFLSARGRARRDLLRASSFMGALAAVGPLFTRIAQAAEGSPRQPAGGRLHVVESTKETVQLGVFDATLPPILTIESGDRVSFPNTWSHFLNGMQPGVPVETLAEWRKANPEAFKRSYDPAAGLRFEAWVVKEGR